jgi:hypothetical protein
VSSASERGRDCVQDLTEVLDALARAQLLARRVGACIEVRDAPPELARLISDAGLACVLRVDVHGQVEEREQCGIDKEVDAGDATA